MPTGYSSNQDSLTITDREAFGPSRDSVRSGSGVKQTNYVTRGQPLADVTVPPPTDGVIAALAVTVQPPTDGVIAALTFSTPPTAAEVGALRDECEILRDSLADAITVIHSLRDECEVLRDSLADAIAVIETLRVHP